MISAQQMEVIARVEQYSDGMLYFWPGVGWSEIAPKSGIRVNGTNWHAHPRLIESMMEAGLATVTEWHHSKGDSYPTVIKIKAP